MSTLTLIVDHMAAAVNRGAKADTLIVSMDVADRAVKEAEDIWVFFGNRPPGFSGKDLKQFWGMTVQHASGFAILRVE